MQRREFLASVPAAGAAAFSGSLPSFDGGPKPDPLIDRVKLAMLSMQRAVWEQGVAMQAMLELGESDLVILMAKEAVLRQSQDGRLAMVGEEFALADAGSPGEGVLWAARKTGDQVLMSGFDKMLEYALTKAPRTKEGVIYHFTNIPQIWSDSCYMMPPFLAAAGKFDEAFRQLQGIWGFLWNSEKKLLSHMWDNEKRDFARKAFWGVGNGWSAAGVTRLLRMFPDSMTKERERLASQLKDLLDGCLVHMRPDGLFYYIVDDPSTFVETNLAQMLAYSIYRGIQGGWLELRYREYADRMRAAARAKVESLGLVQGVCGSPEFDHPGTATEGQAFFILMESAHRDLGA